MGANKLVEQVCRNCPTLCRHPNQIRLQTVIYLSQVKKSRACVQYSCSRDLF